MLDQKHTLVFTGGHHTSGLAVAKVLQKQGWQIIWFGHQHSSWGDKSLSGEYRDVLAENIQFYPIKAGKFYHTFSPIKLILIPYGFIKSFILLVKLKLTLRKRLRGIISFGGYLSVPVVICGKLLGIKSIIHEQTSVTGWANRILSYFVEKIATTWPDSQNLFPKSKTVLTGLPLRAEILSIKRKVNKKQVFIFGGKQGSHIINQVIFSGLEKLLEEYEIIHQTGSNTLFNDYQKAHKLKQQLPAHLQSKYSPVEYLSAKEISNIYQTAGLVVCRSGAHTVYELAYLNIPAVLIPIPWVSHQEQSQNAKILEKTGQAVVINQNSLSVEKLLLAIKTTLTFKCNKIDIPIDATERIVDIINNEFYETQTKNQINHF